MYQLYAMKKIIVNCIANVLGALDEAVFHLTKQPSNFPTDDHEICLHMRTAREEYNSSMSITHLL